MGAAENNGERSARELVETEKCPEPAVSEPNRYNGVSSTRAPNGTRALHLKRHLMALCAQTDIEVIECYASADSTRFKLLGARDYLVFKHLADAAWFPTGRAKSSHGYDGFNDRYHLQQQSKERFIMTRVFREIGMPEGRPVYAGEFAAAATIAIALIRRWM